MSSFASGLMAAAVAATVALASAIPVNAAPVYVPKSTSVTSGVEKAHYRYKKRYGARHYRYRHRCYDDYDCGLRYGYRRHYYEPHYAYRHYPHWRHRHWRRGGITLQFSF